MRHILRAAGELISCRVLQRSCQHLVGQFFFVSSMRKQKLVVSHITEQHMLVAVYWPVL